VRRACSLAAQPIPARARFRSSASPARASLESANDVRPRAATQRTSAIAPTRDSGSLTVMRSRNAVLSKDCS